MGHFTIQRSKESSGQIVKEKKQHCHCKVDDSASTEAVLGLVVSSC